MTDYNPLLNDVNQKDWTLKLFLHNFLKEQKLQNTIKSFESEVLHRQNVNLELPIKSNKTFLLEWWNVFWNLFSDSIKDSFIKSNTQTFPEDLLNKVTLGELFNQSYVENIINNYSQILKPSLLNSMEGEAIIPQAFQMNNINYEIWKNNHEHMFVHPAFINENLYARQNSSETHSISSKSNEFNHSSSNINITNNNLQKKFESTNLNLNKDYLSKIRRRSIKNNKIVFVHPHKALKVSMAANNDSNHINSNIIISTTTEDINNNSTNFNHNNNDIIKIDSSNNQKEDNMTLYSFNEKETLSQSNNKGGKKPRGSRYRGVSRNGNQWQVLIMVNKKKRYVGSYSNEEEAARAYDKAALQNHGSKAKTNYDYSEEELTRITNEPSILKIQDDK